MGYNLNDFLDAAHKEGMGFEAIYWVKLAQVYPTVYDDVQMLIGDELRKQRKQAGLTQIQLASQVFCSAATISNIEHGYIFSNMATFNSICQRFKLMSGSLIYLSQLYCLYLNHQKIEGYYKLPPHMRAASRPTFCIEDDPAPTTQKASRKMGSAKRSNTKPSSNATTTSAIASKKATSGANKSTSAKSATSKASKSAKSTSAKSATSASSQDAKSTSAKSATSASSQDVKSTSTKSSDKTSNSSKKEK